MDPTDAMKITITKNGPYVVSGSVPMARQTILADPRGNCIEWQEGEAFETTATFALCRCGHSANKPHCDGSHLRAGFDGTEMVRSR